MGSERFTPSTPPVADVLADISSQIKAFVHTRTEIFQAEFRESLASWKAVVPLIGAAALLLTTAYLLFTVALVALVVWALPQVAFRWFLALVIVGILWAVLGVVTAYAAIRKLRQPAVVPRKTLEVLKADKEWLEHEIRAA